jgi:RNA polymerase sigma-70 factor (ECF subfamily)
MEFETDFIQRLRAKNQKAFEELYEKTWASLFGFITFKVNGNRSLAEDILSEVYCRAIEYSHTLTLTHNVTGWLFRIAKSKIADHYRKAKREKKLVKVQTVACGREEIMNALANEPESKTIASEDELLLRIGFSRIPEEYRTILELKYVHEKSVVEIATQTGKSEKAVENILYRGRKLLDRELKRAADEKIYCYREGGKDYAAT